MLQTFYSRDNLLNWMETLDIKTISYEPFHEFFINILNQHAPFKQKIVRENQAPFMTKRLFKAIMQMSKLRNKFNNLCPSDENSRLYEQQRNYCANSPTREKKNYFNNLDLKIFNDNKTFWQRVKPLFSDEMCIEKQYCYR